jgi:hypothetical protein
MSLISVPFVESSTDIVLHGIAAVVLIASICAAAVAFWKIHELPIHKAHASEHRQLGLITILTWVGFVWHWVWVLAIIIAFLDVEQSVIRLRDLWHGDTKQAKYNVNETQGDKLC